LLALIARVGSRASCVSLLLVSCGGGSTSVTPPSAEPAEPSAEANTAATLLPESARCELPEPGYGGECNSCLAARCCEPIEACDADAVCSEQLACVVRCQTADDPGRCSMACLGEEPAAGYLAYDDCSFSECLSSCWD